MTKQTKGECEVKKITIDGVDYIRAEAKQPAESFEGMEYKVVRTYSAGVFAGYLESLDGKKAVMRQAIRLWYWKGAASLSQLAMEGVKNPDECKFAMAVDRVLLTEAIEILDCTQAAFDSITGVEPWKK